MGCDNCNNTIKALEIRNLKVCADCADRIGRERLMAVDKLKVKSMRATEDGGIYDLEVRHDDYVIEVVRGQDAAGALAWNYNVVCWDTKVPGMPENRHLLGMGMNYIAVSSAPYHLDALAAAIAAVLAHQERRKNPTPEDKAEAESWRRLGAPLVVRIPA